MAEPVPREMTGGETVDPAPGPLAIVGTIGALIVLISVMLLQVLFYRTSDNEAVRKAGGRSEEVRRLQDEQRARLESYHWVDRERGVVAIPIDRAMELLLSEQGGGGRAR